MQVRRGCAFVLEWNLPFRNPGSTTGMYIYEKQTFMHKQEILYKRQMDEQRIEYERQITVLHEKLMRCDRERAMCVCVCV